MVRILNPVTISFDQATAIAVLGLAVNLGSAWLLWERHDVHHHHNGEEHHHDHHDHRDHNLRAAYLHVLADALTSVLAIVGLLAARLYGWVWMDPLMGIVGAGVRRRNWPQWNPRLPVIGAITACGRRCGSTHRAELERVAGRLPGEVEGR